METQAAELPRTPTSSPVLWALAAAVLGHALVLSDGIYNVHALIWIAIGTALAWAALLYRPLPRPFSGRPWAALSFLIGIAALLWQIQELFIPPHFGQFTTPPIFRHLFIPLLAVSAAMAMLFPSRLTRTLVPVVYFVGGACLLHAALPPRIDVYVLTQDACRAVTQGHDPYAIDFPDLYTSRPDWEAAFYPPGSVSGGRVHFGYQYMPLSLLVALGGYVTAGDFRYGNLLAMALAGLLLMNSGRGARAAAGASLLLLMPRGYYVVQYGWAEPAIVLCLAGVVFCAARWPAGLPWAVGLLLASKQHMILALPAAFLLLPPPPGLKQAAVFWLKASAAAAAVTLPFVLWDVRAFWHSAVVELMHNPFRYDSLNFAAAWARAGHSPPALWIALLPAAAAIAAGLWRGQRSPGAFAAAFAVIYLSLFALARQTFCNYYFLAISALWSAVAA
jgi:hypothetical protein